MADTIIPTAPIPLWDESQQAVIQFLQRCWTLSALQWNFRENMREIDLAFQREMDLTEENVAAQLANSRGDADKVQNVTVPIVLPQVQSAVMYQTSVFLTGSPLFGVVADPESMDAALQLETIIDNNAIRGQWKRQFMLNFQNNFKYNMAAVEVLWDNETTYSIETKPDVSRYEGAPTSKIWSGNKIKNLDLYNTFSDPRVPAADLHKDGEYAGYNELMGRVRLKQYIAALGDRVIKKNVKKALETSCGAPTGDAGAMMFGQYYIPPVNPKALLQTNTLGDFNWLSWAGITTANSSSPINYGNIFMVTTFYARIIPEDFNIRVPGSNVPQVWRFIIINGQVVLVAERLTNAHRYIPVLFSQALEDNLTYQAKSLGSNVLQVQQTASALMNSMIQSRRRAIADRILYDPSRVSAAHINSPNPTARIPVRPAAYGKPLGEAVFPFPYRDDQASLITGEVQQLFGFADLIGGRNPAQRGQFVKGNKTREEFATIMDNAYGRDQMCSIMLEDQLFNPLKEIIKYDILQYQPPTTLLSRPDKQLVQIDPLVLRQTVLEFKVSDGLVPSSKLIDGDTLAVALQMIGTSPQLAGGYNTSPLFSYLIKTKGADLTPFEKSPQQIAYEQALQAWNAQVAQLNELYKTVIQKASEESLDALLEKIQKAIPPQPKPADFGYNPAPATPQATGA